MDGADYFEDVAEAELFEVDVLFALLVHDLPD